MSDIMSKYSQLVLDFSVILHCYMIYAFLDTGSLLVVFGLFYVFIHAYLLRYQISVNDSSNCVFIKCVEFFVREKYVDLVPPILISVPVNPFGLNEVFAPFFWEKKLFFVAYLKLFSLRLFCFEICSVCILLNLTQLEFAEIITAIAKFVSQHAFFFPCIAILFVSKFFGLLVCAPVNHFNLMFFQVIFYCHELDFEALSGLVFLYVKGSERLCFTYRWFLQSNFLWFFISAT